MSISLVLIPAVLVLRVAMGGDKFQSWVESSQIKIPTCFTSEKELVNVVKMAGYDANRIGRLIKTHINGEREFIFWENINGVWNIVVSKYTSQDIIRQFITELENRAEKKVVFTKTNPIVTKSNIEIFPTNIVDKNLLVKTIRDYGINYKEISNGDIQCNIGNCLLTFRKECDSNYEVEVEGTDSLKNAYLHLKLIDEEYKHNVQEYTYTKVVEKLEDKNMYIEKEEVLDDNSIVLTINIS